MSGHTVAQNAHFLGLVAAVVVAMLLRGTYEVVSKRWASRGPGWWKAFFRSPALPSPEGAGAGPVQVNHQLSAGSGSGEPAVGGVATPPPAAPPVAPAGPTQYEDWGAIDRPAAVPQVSPPPVVYRPGPAPVAPAPAAGGGWSRQDVEAWMAQPPRNTWSFSALMKGAQLQFDGLTEATARRAASNAIRARGGGRP